MEARSLVVRVRAAWSRRQPHPHSTRGPPLAGRPSPGWFWFPVTGPARSRRAPRSRRRCHDVLRTGREVEARAEREGSRYVVVGGIGAVCGWHPDLLSLPGPPVWPAATIEASIRPPCREGCPSRPQRPPTSARAVSSSSPALLLAPSTYSQNVMGGFRCRTRLLLDQQPGVDHRRLRRQGRDHHSPVGDLARRLGGRAGEPEGSAGGRSGRRAGKSDREGLPAHRITGAALHEDAHKAELSRPTCRACRTSRAGRTCRAGSTCLAPVAPAATLRTRRTREDPQAPGAPLAPWAPWAPLGPAGPGGPVTATPYLSVSPVLHFCDPAITRTAPELLLIQNGPANRRP